MSQPSANSSTDTQAHTATSEENVASIPSQSEGQQRLSEKYGPHVGGEEKLDAPGSETETHGGAADSAPQQPPAPSHAVGYPASNAPMPQQIPDMYGAPPGSAQPGYAGAAPQQMHGTPPSQGFDQQDPYATGGYGYVSPGGASDGIDRSHVAAAVRTARQNVASAASRNARRNKLQLRRVDPWSVMRFSFAVSIVIFIASVVATALLYTVLDAMGVFDSVNETISSLATAEDGKGDEAAFEIDAKLVIGGAAMLGAVNMVLFTATATLGAFVYNVCADLAGGIELTLAERE